MLPVVLLMFGTFTILCIIVSNDQSRLILVHFSSAIRTIVYFMARECFLFSLAVLLMLFTTLDCLLCDMFCFTWANKLCAWRNTICPRPLYAVRCGPAAAHPLRLQGPARIASSSCGRHEYSRCTRQTSDVVKRASSLNDPYPYGRGIKRWCNDLVGRV